MKKKRRKVIERLTPLIGKEIIRTKPAMIPIGNDHERFEVDYSWNNIAVTFCGFTPEGNLQIRTPWGSEVTLKEYHTTSNWITYEKAKNSGYNSLNQWKGRKIRRTVFMDGWSTSFMDKDGLTLVHASEYHVFLINCDGEEVIADCRYTNPNEWELVE